MALPTSNQFRVCTSCDASIEPGHSFAHDPDGDIVCEDCIPADFDLDQYDDDAGFYDDDRYGFADYSWEEDGCYE